VGFPVIYAVNPRFQHNPVLLFDKTEGGWLHTGDGQRMSYGASILGALF
jgi:hypothetical protein